MSEYRSTSTRRYGKRLTSKERAQAQETFLNAYTLNGNIMLSCRRANIDRSTFYQWLEHDQPFSLEYHQAEKDFADLALAEFCKRAMQGYERPVVSMGKIVYQDGKDGKLSQPLMERVVSDNLLAMLIKRHFPEFREKQQVEHSGSIDINAAKETLAQKLAQLRGDEE
jgi:hypothetical protein